MSNAQTLLIQDSLRAMGIYRGPIDGAMGKATTEAIIRFRKSLGMSPVSQIDRRVRRKMMSGAKIGASGVPAWVRYANYLANSDRPYSPRRWFNFLSRKMEPDFVSGLLGECGIKCPATLRGIRRSGNRIPQAALGCIVILKDKSVGILTGATAPVAGLSDVPFLTVIGAKTGCPVKKFGITASEVRAYIWPLSATKPKFVGIKTIMGIK